jgi:anti-anti-sigma regulatory factor
MADCETLIGDVSVFTVSDAGEPDNQTFRDLTARVQRAVSAESRKILIDLSGVADDRAGAFIDAVLASASPAGASPVFCGLREPLAFALGSWHLPTREHALEELVDRPPWLPWTRVDELANGAVLILTVHGEMCPAGSTRPFGWAILRALARGHRRLIADLADVPYTDSGGVTAITHAVWQTDAAGGRIVFCGLGPHVELGRFGAGFLTAATRDEAMAVFAQPPVKTRCPVAECAGTCEASSTVDADWLVCNRCRARVQLLGTVVNGRATVSAVRFPTYEAEYVELLPGRVPSSIRVVGRLDLWALGAIEKAWATLPVPRAPVIDLQETTELTEPAIHALNAFHRTREPGSQASLAVNDIVRASLARCPSSPDDFSSQVSRDLWQAAYAVTLQILDPVPLTVEMRTIDAP